MIARGAARLVYAYDYGDNWRRDVIVEEVRDSEPDREYPAFVYGGRRCPPKDVGGSVGFMGYPKADFDPAHEQHRDMVLWYGGAFDPTSLCLCEVRARFGFENMARRRRGPRIMHTGGKRRRKRGSWPVGLYAH